MEVCNRPVHAVAQLGWVRTMNGGHEMRMAVQWSLVRPGRYQASYRKQALIH